MIIHTNKVKKQFSDSHQKWVIYHPDTDFLLAECDTEAQADMILDGLLNLPEGIAARQVIQHMTIDMTCCECGSKITDHVVVSRCGNPECEEHFTAPPLKKVFEFKLEEVNKTLTK